MSLMNGITNENISLYQKWVVYTHPTKLSGFSDSWIALIKKNKLFDKELDFDYDFDEIRKHIKVLGEKNGWSKNYIGVCINAISSYEKFIKFMRESPNNRNKLNDIIVRPKEKGETKEKVQDTQESILEEITSDLLNYLQNMNCYDFEALLTDLFNKMGYGEATTTKKSGDGGIDVIVSRDALDLEKIFVQAKRYKANNLVNEAVINQLSGTVNAEGASFGIVITTSDFNNKALENGKKQKNIKLISGEELCELLVKYEVGVVLKKTISYFEVDKNYFEVNKD